MNKCKDCKYWDKEKGKNYGECRQVDYFQERSHKDNEAAMDVNADDDSNLSAHFIAGPEFGCTSFSPFALDPAEFEDK